METFRTQFTMSGVRTNATIQVLEKNKFSFALHFSDAYEGDELVPAEGKKDGTIVRNETGRWELAGESKVDLSEEDIQNLGAAIVQDYLNV